MRFLRQNTAVLVTVGPFYDKTDGVTIETALTITNERISLTADTDDNSAPTNILDNVTGATSGTSNDLNYITGNDAGMMQLELSAANTNRVGRMLLSITDAANHVPVFHEFFVLPQAIYDWITGVTVNLPVNVAQFGGSNGTFSSGRPEVNTTHAAGTAWGSGAITAGSIAADAITNAKIADNAIAVENIADNAITAAKIAADAIGASELAADAVTEIQSGLATSSALSTVSGKIDTIDDFLDTEIAAILADTNELQTDLVNGGRIDLLIDAIKAKTDNLPSDPADASVIAGRFDTLDTAVADIPTNSELSTALAAADDAVLSAIGTVDTVVDAIKVTTDKLDDTLEDDGGTYRYTTNALEQSPTGGSAPTASEIADAVWGEDITDHSGISSSTAEALNAAGAAGDPWTTALPGAYGSGSAGHIIGNNLNATVSSRASQTSVDDLPTNAELATALGTADDAVLSAIAALNNLSQANIRTAVGLATANLDTQLADLPTNSELATALASADDAVLAAIAALNNLSQANVRTAVGLASANLDTQLSSLATASALATVATYVDTEVAAIKAKTDNLPTDPADASEIAASFSSIASSLTTLAGYIDTEVAAILAAVDTEVAAIKAKTDQFNFGVTGKVDANITHVNETEIDGSGIEGDPFVPA